jgi:beta-glucanase (GH16 family)
MDAGSGGAKADSGAAGSSSDAGQPAPLGLAGSWRLSFSDEFNGSAIDTTKWRIMDTADPVYWGTQKWRAADSFLDGNGLLVTRLTTASGSLTGGAIYSKWKLSKGYYEARIKHEGGWFAWWIESPENGSGGANEDPAVYGTEMDLCEADAWTANVLDKQHAIHWHGYGQYHQTVSASTGIHDNQWHVYGFKWSDAAYDFYVDGAPTYHFTTAISQTLDEDMIINNASYMGSQTSGIAYVDYVRYWTPQ